MKLYHVTKKENIERILEQGLLPQCGSNSILCGEKEPSVYLCDSHSVPYWQILTGADTVLSVDTDIECSTFEYDCYLEKICKHRISPADIRMEHAPSQEDIAKAMQNLAKSYTYTVSGLCYSMLKRAAIIKEKADMDTWTEDLLLTVLSTLEIMKRIDFRVNSQWDYRRLITEYSNEDCAITFSDYYYPGRDAQMIPDAGKRCFEHLPNLPEPFTCVGTALYGFITKTYSKCVLYPQNIGGFCV